MTSFPLIRTRLSNERLMTALLSVLILYNLPRWIARPADVGSALLLLLFGLVLDTAVNYFRFHRPLCAVSAAITVFIQYTLSPGAPVWGELLALMAALLFGKHIWGGAGKNPINPAMVGLLILGLLFQVKMPVFIASYWLLPAIVLSLPFMAFRPFAALGMMSGMTAALLLHQNLTWAGLVSYGVVLWSCLVITDPVTTTAKPPEGFVIGILAGFAPLAAGDSTAAMALAVLVTNSLSAAADHLSSRTGMPVHLKFKKRRQILFSRENTAYHDMSGDAPPAGIAADMPADMMADEILRRIGRSKVFGFGGAAFPTEQKIRTVMNAKASEKHLIVNGAECDPGLIHDKWLLTHRSDAIMQGIEWLRRCVPFATITVAAKNIAGLAFSPPVRLRRVPDYYPAGAEKILIRNILRMNLDYNVIPAAEGILVLNVQTVFSIYEAVSLNRPADSRLITLADMNANTGRVMRVRLGSKVQDVMEKAGTAGIFIGGGIMNARIADADAVVGETVNFLAAGRYPKYIESLQCSRCGLCSAVCPARLPVRELAFFVDEGKPERAMRFHPEQCLSCGSCSYVCLAGKNLAAKVAELKKQQSLPPAP
ncbi:MAG: RnfABCDGE type electron transport complex subunit D [Clostridiaceae bacterium]|nr:RnfABCDGE type electron transport complex subunit D [Clostridiaceae bacterium]